MATLTSCMLLLKGACEGQVTLFREVFGTKVEVTVALCVEHADKFDFDWAAHNLLNPEAFAAYKAAREQAFAIYKEAGEQAFATYKATTAPARGAYKVAKARAFAELFIKQEGKMTDTTRAWDGRPKNPERDGWHWVQTVKGTALACWWETAPALWTTPVGDCALEPAEVAADGWRYLGPALLPAQVAAAVEAERETTRTALREIHNAGLRFGESAEARMERMRETARVELDRARGPSDALAAALRQARAEGMREAAEICANMDRARRFDHQDLRTCEAAELEDLILAAADAKEKGDG